MSDIVTVIVNNSNPSSVLLTSDNQASVSLTNNNLSVAIEPVQVVVNLIGNPVAFGSNPSADNFYLNFNQLSPSDTWVIAHNLGKKPNVKAYSVGGREMWAEPLHLSDNVLQILFDSPVSGFAILS